MDCCRVALNDGSLDLELQFGILSEKESEEPDDFLFSVQGLSLWKKQHGLLNQGIFQAIDPLAAEKVIKVHDDFPGDSVCHAEGSTLIICLRQRHPRWNRGDLKTAGDLTLAVRSWQAAESEPPPGAVYRRTIQNHPYRSDTFLVEAFPTRNSSLRNDTLTESIDKPRDPRL
jgi:hypothetical protein